MDAPSSGTVPPEHLKAAHRVEYAWAVVVLALVAWSYLWTATSAANPYST